MSRIVIIMLWVCSTSIFAQKASYSVHIGGNLPLIQSLERNDTRWWGQNIIKESYQPKSGLSFSTNVKFTFSSKFFMKSGLTAHYVRSERKIFDYKYSPHGYGVINISESDIAGNFPELVYMYDKPNGSITTTYLQVPVILGASFFDNRLSIGVGLTFSRLMQATLYNEIRTWKREQNQIEISQQRERSTSAFNPYAVGGVADVNLRVNNRFSIDLAFQKNFTQLYVEEKQVAGKAKLNLLSFGIGYHLNSENTRAFSKKVGTVIKKTGPKLSLRFAANLPLIPSQQRLATFSGRFHDNDYSGPMSGNVRESYHPATGVSLSGRVHLAVSSHVFLTTGLTLQQVRYDRTLSYNNLSTDGIEYVEVPGWELGYFIGPGERHFNQNDYMFNDERNPAVTTNFLQLPIIGGTTLLHEKLSVGVGVNFSQMLKANAYTYRGREGSATDFTTLSVGGIAEASYKLAGNWSIDISFQKTFNSLYRDQSQIGGKAKLNLLSFGIGYHFNK